MTLLTQGLLTFDEEDGLTREDSRLCQRRENRRPDSAVDAIEHVTDQQTLQP
jgi:hypothetical protein